MFDPEDEKSQQQGLPEDSDPAEEPHEQSVSLEGLSEAFAEALGKPDPTAVPTDDEGHQTQEPASHTLDPQAESDDEQEWTEAADGANEPDADEEAAEGLPNSYQDDPESVDFQGHDSCPISPHTIFEAMLFVGNTDNRPLESRRAAELMRGVEPEEIPDIVDQLNERYSENACPYTIVAEGVGYRLKLTEQLHPLRNKFYGSVREARLSQAAIEVLAIVAYRQPISSEDVNRLRDKPCSHILSQLVRRRLLQIERPADKSAKAVYLTTDRFLQLFGLDNIDELPKSEGDIG